MAPHFRVGLELALGQGFVFKDTYFDKFRCLGAEINEPGRGGGEYLLDLDDLSFYYGGYY